MMSKRFTVSLYRYPIRMIDAGREGALVENRTAELFRLYRASSGLLRLSARAHACYGRFLSAEWASLVFLNVEYPELYVERVVDQQATRQRVSYAGYEFEDLRGLDQANLPWHDAQDAFTTVKQHLSGKR